MAKTGTLYDKYFLLNVSIGEKGKKRNAVDEWIGERKFAPIFYGENTLEDIRAGKNADKSVSPVGFAQAIDFVSVFDDFADDSRHSDKILVSLGENEIYFYQKSNNFFEMFDIEGINPKGFGVEIIAQKPICECPLVLASIKSNTHLGRGTFHEIPQDKAGSYLGNIKAIDWILSGKSKISVKSFEEYLQCLSSLEFETLIAKIKEEQKFFVPAYKGGFLKDLDLICRKGGETEKLQIKLHLSKGEYDKYSGNKNLHFYCITKDKIDEKTVEKRKQKIFAADDIEKDLQKCAKAKEWLQKDLRWVDFKF